MAEMWSLGVVPAWAASADEAGRLVLDQSFDPDSLHELRNCVRAAAVAAGMPDDKAAQVMLAVHELAANSVLHGGGAGWARMRVVGAQLYCAVSDPGQRGAGDGEYAHGDRPDRDSADGAAWLIQAGHGLSLVRSIADQFSVASGPGGSQVIAVFELPEFQVGVTGVTGQ